MSSTARLGGTVDGSALPANQGSIVGLVLLGFVAGGAIGAALTGKGPFQLLYRHVLRPAGLVNPRPEPGEASPHRFAQTLGAAVLAAAYLTLAAGATALGWTLALLVLALALVNLVFGFCAGCFACLQLRRLWRATAGARP